MKIPDRLNPRLWLRNWLLKPGLSTRVNTTAQGEPKAVEYGRGITPLNLTEVRSIRFSAEERLQHPVGVAVSRLPAARSQLSPPAGLTASTQSEPEAPSSRTWLITSVTTLCSLSIAASNPSSGKNIGSFCSMSPSLRAVLVAHPAYRKEGGSKPLKSGRPVHVDHFASPPEVRK